MDSTASAREDDDQFKDLSSLLKEYMTADGVIDPDKAPPDMRVMTDLVLHLIVSSCTNIQ